MTVIDIQSFSKARPHCILCNAIIAIETSELYERKRQTKNRGSTWTQMFPLSWHFVYVFLCYALRNRISWTFESSFIFLHRRRRSTRKSSWQNTRNERHFFRSTFYNAYKKATSYPWFSPFYGTSVSHCLDVF